MLPGFCTFLSQLSPIPSQICGTFINDIEIHSSPSIILEDLGKNIDHSFHKKSLLSIVEDDDDVIQALF